MPFVGCLEEMFTRQREEKALRNLALNTLTKRFGTIPDNVDRLNAIHDLPQLHHLAERSFFVASTSEFAAQL